MFKYVIIFLLSTSVFAEEIYITKPKNINTFEEVDVFKPITNRICTDINGLEIPMYIVSEDVVPEKLKAIADIDINRKPFMAINRNVFNTLVKKKTALVFLFYHECAHHYLGHIRYDYAHRRNDTTLFFSERNADCLAARWFNEDFGRDALPAAVEFTGVGKGMRYNKILLCSNFGL